MTWKRFDEKLALPREHNNSITLTTTGQASKFSFSAWRGAVGKTHAVYHIDEDRRRIGIQLLDASEASENDMSAAYKIQSTGWKNFSVNCGRLLQYMPFPLVEMKPMPRNKLESGKWILKSYIEDGLIIIESEVAND